MLVMITRPRDDAERLAELLAPLGVRGLVEPMFDIAMLPATLDFDGVQAILITSANGARALGQATDRRDLPVLAVGEQSATAARAIGFGDVAAAEGDVASLAAMVAREIDPAAGKLIHVAGTVVAGDLSGTLEEFGFEVNREVLYDARPVSALSPAGARALTEKSLDGVLFFSPRTVHTFARLVDQAGLAPNLVDVVAYCLSPAVARATSRLPWRVIQTAARTDQAAMVDLVRADANGSEEPT